jgi:hypothetical protein
MPEETAPSDQPAPKTVVDIDRRLLLTAFNEFTRGIVWYLHPATAQLFRMQEDVAGAPSLAGREGFLVLEPPSSAHQYRWMERYIAAIADPALASRLAQAISGNGCFQRFKIILTEHPARADEWACFRAEQLWLYVRIWLHNHDLVVPAMEAPPEHLCPVLDSRVDLVRRERFELIIRGLTAQEMESLIRLAEFLRASPGAPSHRL